MKTLLLLNGPNLNLLGYRDIKLYGSTTLAEIEKNVREPLYPGKNGTEVFAKQSRRRADSLFKRTVFISCEEKNQSCGHYHQRRCLFRFKLRFARRSRSFSKPLETKIIEVHLSNIYARAEEFRHHSVISRQASGVVCGLGADGYTVAAKHMLMLK